MKQYLENHEWCEVCGNIAKQVHHIFSKRKNAKVLHNSLNFVALCPPCHYKAEFTDVQGMANKIFQVKIDSCGQDWIDYANEIAHKTWAGSPFQIGLGAGASSNPALQTLDNKKNDDIMEA